MIENLSIHTTIIKLAKPLANFLEEYLSMTDTKWWNNKVKPCFKDEWKIDNLRSRDLHKLDTCALLTIFFKNLKLLTELAGLDFYTVKNYIRESRTIRAKYMHSPSDFEASDEDLAWDFNTLYCFCKVINAEKKLLEELDECRKYYILKAIAPQEETKPVEAAAEQPAAPAEVPAPETEEVTNSGFFPFMQPIPTPVVMMNVSPAMMYGMMYNNFGMRY